MIVTDAAVRDGLLRDLHIRKTLEVARSADIILVGIGAANEYLGQYRAGYLDAADLPGTRARGAVGEVIDTYLSLEGRVVPLKLDERFVGLDFREIKMIPLRVEVNWGVHKALANIGAQRPGERPDHGRKYGP